MPLYSYRCKACGKAFEELASMDRRDDARCPECGGEARRAWEGPCTFGVNFSGGKERELPCAGQCGCGGRCALQE